MPILVISDTAGMVRPLRRMSTSAGWRGEVEIPDVVMDELLIPLDLSGVGVDGKKRVAVEIVPVMRTAVIVVADFFGRHEDQAALDVH